MGYAGTSLSVPENIDLEEALYVLKNKNALPENSNKENLDKEITKKEFIKMILSALNYIPKEKKIISECSELEDNNVFAPYLNEAINLNALIPDQEKNCNSGNTLTKLNAMQIIFQIAGIPTPKFFNIEKKPQDFNINSAYAPIIAKALDINLLQTDENNRINATQKIKYIDAIELTYKTLLYVDPDVIYEIDFSDFDEEILEKENTSEIPNINTLIQVLESVSKNYYFQEKDKINKNDLVYRTIEALTMTLSDPYTIFQTPESEELQYLLEDHFVGIGVQITMDANNNLELLSVFRNSPADLSGLKAKDQIIKINGQNIKEKTLDQVSALLKGEISTEVLLTIFRPDKNKNMDFKLIRAEVNIEQISYRMLTSDIGLIEFTIFSEDSDEEFTNAIDNLKKLGMTKLVIDLRDNPGGYLESTINILNNFVKNGQPITYFKLLNHTVAQYANGNADLNKTPLVVLVNEGSASASEVFAAAIQDYKIGLILGTKTFGKGTVQTLEIYEDDSILKMTVAEWLRPNFGSINKVGITPDTVLENPINLDEQMKTAIEYLEKIKI
ncbi:hypothetical protein A2229_02720 [Candidatus Peregrinibacteria bacterium RIFOXYA2_FULL_33_7]|nr:MAG: hypothetical protein A2229_02720 [Candidatus Peregrinibacteria bacterium RIFOXYA2_FULL_33_7]